MDIKNTIQQVIDVIAQELTIDASTITPESTLSSLGADSLDTVEIIMRLEEQFGIEISDEDAEKLTNITQIAQYVHSKRTINNAAQ